ncbi:uncharacterized protein LOC134805064 [Cydia splendana]
MKEQLQLSKTIEEQTQRGFAMVQVQLDKIFQILQQNIKTGQTAPMTATTVVDEEIALGDITFPINALNELELLERHLSDAAYEKVLIKHFSKVCGESGRLKVAKIGLVLIKAMITDELLTNFTWKGIKPSPKIAFYNFFRLRKLIFSILKLADHNCAAQDVDNFLQNSVIKHCTQRNKRKLSNQLLQNSEEKKKEEGNETHKN